MRIVSTLAFAALMVGANVSFATPLALWASGGWTQFADDDGTLGPGGGGQAFDAEYLYYKLDGNVLSLGLQTGFDIVDGHIVYDNQSFYAGDLALSFNNHVILGNSSTYEYAVDFGLLTKNINQVKVDAGSGTGIDPAGFYSVSAWNNQISFGQSSPFAMDAGSLITGLLTNAAGQVGSSYYRTVSFDISSLGLGSNFSFDAHWTMSCGNDVIDGRVPEPNSALLFGALLIGLVKVVSKKRKV